MTTPTCASSRSSSLPGDEIHTLPSNVVDNGADLMDPRSVIGRNPHFTESRLNSLYSEFSRLKILNPDGYDANIAAWLSVLHDLVSRAQVSHSCFSLSTSEPALLGVLAIPVYGKPRGMAAVFDQLCADSVLVFEQEFLETGSGGLTTWLAKRLSGVIFKRSCVDSRGNLLPRRYVVRDLVVAAAVKCRERASAHGQSVYTDTLLKAMLQREGTRYSDADYELLVAQLSRDESCTVATVDGRRYVRFGALTGADISAQERGIADLHASLLVVASRKDTVERAIRDLDALVRVAMTRRTDRAARAMILGKLAQKRALTQSLDRVVALHDDLETMKIKVSEAAGNARAFGQLQRTLLLLRELNRFSVDDVDAVKDDLARHIATTDAVSLALGHESEHDPAIDAEYELLLAQEREREQEQNQEQEQEQQQDQEALHLAEKLGDLALASPGNIVLGSGADAEENRSSEPELKLVEKKAIPEAA